jgi:drug/metabolite transporter (DMT)-like permease
VFTYVNPAVATLLGIIVLDEPFGVSLIIGMGLILLGSWTATTHRAVPRERRAPL